MNIRRPDALIDFDDLPNGVIAIRDDSIILGVNTAMLTTLGCELEEMVGRPISRFLTRPSMVLFQSVVNHQLLSSGRVDETYLDFTSKSGAPVPVLCSAAIHKKQAHALIVISVTMLSERRRIEADLLRTKRVTDQIPGVVYQYLVGADGRHSVPYASDALKRLFGLDPRDVRDSADLLLTSVHPDDITPFLTSIERSANTLEPWHLVFRTKVDSQEYRWLEGHSTPERLADDSTLWHGFVQDITDRKLLEDALLERQAADRLAQARNELVARVSHELRTPLNAILGFAQVLALDDAQPLQETQRNRVRCIEEAGRNLLGLVDEVADIGGIDTGAIAFEPEWLNLKALFTRVARLVEDSARLRRVKLRVEVHSTISVHADSARLAQVLINLLSNAINFVDEGGKVTASCSIVNKVLIISIHDSGPGMTKQQLGLLFEPFSTLGAERSSVRGTGLGLVIVKRLVDAMKGTIEVTSSAAEGTTFCITLPQQSRYEPVASAPPAVAEGPLRDPLPHSRPAAVLYVEDNPVNALIMQAICELQQGFTLHIEETVCGAVEWARDNPVDLMLLDMGLPDGDGIDLLKKLRTSSDVPADIEAIAVSADATPDIVEKARLAGFSQYWTKPLDVKATLDKISYALGVPRTLLPQGFEATNV